MKLAFALAIFIFVLFCCTALASPVEITIDYGNCTESWSCSGWTACSNEVQTQTCTDLNNCGTIISEPATSQSCSSGQQNGGGGGTPPAKAGNKTITQPKPNIPSTPELKESPNVKLELSTIDEIESGEPFTVNVTISSTMDISTTIELLGVEQDVSLNAGESKTLYFDVYAPETGGYYNLVASTPYATGNKTILLDYKPLFLYVNHIENQTYEIHIKNFDNTSTTELDVIKDNSETVYLDILDGKIDYKVNLTFSNPGDYMVRARAMYGFSLLDEDTRTFKIEGNPGIDYGMIILGVVVIVILIASIILFKGKKVI